VTRRDKAQLVFDLDDDFRDRCFCHVIFPRNVCLGLFLSVNERKIALSAHRGLPVMRVLQRMKQPDRGLVASGHAAFSMFLLLPVAKKLMEYAQAPPVEQVGKADKLQWNFDASASVKKNVFCRVMWQFWPTARLVKRKWVMEFLLSIHDLTISRLFVVGQMRFSPTCVCSLPRLLRCSSLARPGCQTSYCAECCGCGFCGDLFFAVRAVH